MGKLDLDFKACSSWALCTSPFCVQDISGAEPLGSAQVKGRGTCIWRTGSNRNSHSSPCSSYSLATLALQRQYEKCNLYKQSFKVHPLSKSKNIFTPSLTQKCNQLFWENVVTFEAKGCGIALSFCLVIGACRGFCQRERPPKNKNFRSRHLQIKGI